MIEKNPFDERPVTERVVISTDRTNDRISLEQGVAISIICRLAEVEDELDRRGIDPLVKEKEELRKRLKTIMLDTNTEIVYDEVSEWEAVITERSKDVWNAEILAPLLAQSQVKRYVKRMVDERAVKDGIKNGDLSRPTLEKAGAVKKEVGAKALYVRKRKERVE